MAKYIEKISRAWQIVKQNGGLLGSYMTFYRTDDLKQGTLVGEDSFGNRYYENKMYFIGRSRWVIYNETVNVNYDASTIPPEWHRWIHYITDDPPTKVPLERRKWMLPHTVNLSGTPKEYVPYTTTRPKIQSWEPPKS